MDVNGYIKGEKMATIRDIAREAGVSLATVSRVINHIDNVSDKAKERVEEVIERLGYNPNSAARSLATKRTNTIGVIVNNLHDPFFYDLIRGFEYGAQNTSYNVIFCSVLGGDADMKERYIKYLTNGIVDGVVLYGSYLSDAGIISGLMNSNVNYILIENDIENLDCNKLLVDNYNGSRKAVEYLISMGHKKIAFICGNPNRQVSVDRLNGYLDAMRKNNLNIEDGYLQYASNNYQSGHAAMKILMQLDAAPTVVYCHDDVIASKAVLAARDMGLSVPADVSIMGFDDQRVLPDGYKGPDITSVAQPLYDVGVESIKILAGQLAGKTDLKKVRVVYDTHIVERDTVKKYKPKN